MAKRSSQKYCSVTCRTKVGHRNYRKRNPDLKDKENYKYFQDTGETKEKYTRRYYLNNKDRIRKRNNAYDLAHRGHLLLKKKENYEQNKKRYAYQKFVINDVNRFGGNKQAVLERDNWECQECGMNGEQHIVIYGMGLHVHHIDGDNTNHFLDNLQTLCMKCHRKTFDLKGIKKRNE